MQPIVSIITPCFNADKYLSETLDCLQKQTLYDWECIIVNDGSTDSSSDIAHEYAAKDSRYVVIDKENEGPSVARNVGIKASHGKYILPLDADDLIEPSYLELAVDYLENCDDCKVVYCEGDYFGDKHGNLEWAIFKGYKSLLLQNSTFNAIVFKKQDALLIGGYDEKMRGYEDWDFVIRLLNGSNGVYQIPYCLFHYRKSDQHESVNDKAEKRHEEFCNYIYKKNLDLYIKFYGAPIFTLKSYTNLFDILNWYAFWFHRTPVKIIRFFLKIYDKIRGVDNLNISKTY